MEADTGFADRDRILDYLSKQLIGPLEGDDEVLDDKPQHRYLTAILYPMPADSGAPVTGRSDNDDEIIDEAPGQLADDDDDDPITLSGQTRPSSVGLSFMATEWSDIEVEIEAGQYQPAEDGYWQRKQVKLPCTVPVRADQASSGLYVHRVPVLDGKASVDVRWRAYGNGTIVTVALVNRQSQQEPWSIAADECLFQVVLRCWPKSGTIDSLPEQAASVHRPGSRGTGTPVQGHTGLCHRSRCGCDLDACRRFITTRSNLVLSYPRSPRRLVRNTWQPGNAGLVAARAYRDRRTLDNRRTK